MERRLGAGTALCGVILHPAGHTRSPAMHNAAFAALGIDAAYLAFDVAPEQLGDAIRGARALGIRQLAVSLPHKSAVMAWLDEVDPRARRIGAVNTVTRADERLVGSNTDWLGAVRAVEERGGLALAGCRAAVLGAGGTARAVVYGLLERGARVAVWNRTPERAEALRAELGAERAGPLEGLADWPYDLLFNSTRVGLSEDASPVPAGLLRPESLVVDAVYEPRRTRLLRDAEQRGARTLGGKWMLVHQAAAQIRTWTGLEPPVEAMARAFDEAGAG